MATKSPKQIIEEAAKKFAKILQSRMPVRTGKLRKGIKYEVEVDKDGFDVLIIAEDYLKWLKDRTKPLPTNVLKWTGVVDQLPEMNKLGGIKLNELSVRSKNLFSGLNFEDFLNKNELSLYYTKEIEKLIETELK